jgi:hypothetical protein
LGQLQHLLHRGGGELVDTQVLKVTRAVELLHHLFAMFPRSGASSTLSPTRHSQHLALFPALRRAGLLDDDIHHRSAHKAAGQGDVAMQACQRQLNIKQTNPILTLMLVRRRGLVLVR